MKKEVKKEERIKQEQGILNNCLKITHFKEVEL